MEDCSIKHSHLERAQELVASAGGDRLRELLTIGIKACLSSIPWAALVFDLGEKVVTLAGQREQLRFLEALAHAVDRLESERPDVRACLAEDALYQALVRHGMMRIAEGLIDEGFLAGIRNAALNLSATTADRLWKQEVARTIHRLSGIHLLVLRIYDRYWRDDLTASEREGLPDTPEHGLRLGALIHARVRHHDIGIVVQELRDLGLLLPGIGGGLLGDGPYLDDVKLTEFGATVLGILLSEPVAAKCD